jgi:hypothetical protein
MFYFEVCHEDVGIGGGHLGAPDLSIVLSIKIEIVFGEDQVNEFDK